MQIFTRSALNLKEFKRKTSPVCISMHCDAEYAQHIGEGTAG